MVDRCTLRCRYPASRFMPSLKCILRNADGGDAVLKDARKWRCDMDTNEITLRNNGPGILDDS